MRGPPRGRPLAVALMLFLGTADAAASPVDEHSLKAAVMLNFARFVDWPSQNEKEFVIGVLGDERVGHALQAMAANRQVHGRDLTVVIMRTPNELRICHLLYVGESMRPHLPKVMEVLRDQPVLTVSDIEGFLEHGGVIRIYVHNERIHFQVGLRAAEAKRLRISSRLLGLAKRVDN